MNIIVAGGSGFIGGHLVKVLLEKGRRVTVLTRGGGAVPPGAESSFWDGREAGAWEEALGSCDALVNISGAGVADRPWTQARRRILTDSRLESTRALVDALGRAPKRPAVFVNASAVGIYGEGGERELTEESPRGSGFLADLCARWEAEAARAQSLGVRSVHLRLGVVLGRGGGALARMLLPFKLGLGGRLGDGRQFMPWVHAADAVGLALAAVENAAYRGPVNAVAPEAATNAEFTAALGRALGRPTLFPVPAFALKLALGKMSELLLGSQKVRPAAALKAGYKFVFPRLDEALADIVMIRE